MDQLQPARGRSPSVNIKQSHSPSPSPAHNFDSNVQATSNINTDPIGLGLTLDGPVQFATSTQPDFSAYDTGSGVSYLSATQPGLAQSDLAFDPNQSFADQLKADPGSASYGQSFLDPQPTFNGDDFTIFPPPSSDQLATPLFDHQQQPPSDQAQFGTPDVNNMATSQAPHSPTPPHLLTVDPHPGSAHQSPSFSTHQFVQPPGRHSRNVSLGPEAALLPGQDWTGPHFQGHRRNGSEYSDASSIGGHSPSLVGQDGFSDGIDHSSPMLRPEETGDVYQELHGINSFSISSNQPGRSPSHSPAISPRIVPQTIVEGSPSGFILQGQNDGYSPYMSALGPASEAFPQLPTTSVDLPQPMPQMAAPTIEIQYAPNTISRNAFENKLDTDALTPPEQRGRSRRRAITDPYNGGSAPGGRSSPNPGGLSPNLGADLSRTDASRSLSPLERSGSAVAGNRRRLSTSAVPNNLMALRLADPDFAAASSTETGTAGAVSGAGTKRAQKHPATFQCSLCPKRFTRAYNLRSHLRTHTDERPFVCTFCGKAFARQHDRKRHEGLHSGEKKFVCKGDLKIGGEWGCGRRFARADALGRHFRSEAGRICIKPLLDEEFLERQRVWQEQHMQAQAAAQQNMLLAQPPPQIDPNTGYPMDASGNYSLPAALLAQYPALAQVNWSAVDMSGAGSGMEDDLSGRSSFDASDLDDGDDGGYVSGPGTGFGDGGMGENFGEMGYTSDFGGR